MVCGGCFSSHPVNLGQPNQLGEHFPVSDSGRPTTKACNCFCSQPLRDNVSQIGTNPKTRGAEKTTIGRSSLNQHIAPPSI